MQTTQLTTTQLGVGFRRPDQVDPILGAANLELDEDDVATIEGRG